MRAGALRHRVTVQERSETADGRGGRQVAWSGVARLWAEIRAASGRESVIASQLTAVLSSVVSVRWQDGLSVKQRLVCGDRTLQIEHIDDPTGRGEELRLMCSEVQGTT